MSTSAVVLLGDSPDSAKLGILLPFLQNLEVIETLDQCPCDWQGSRLRGVFLAGSEAVQALSQHFTGTLPPCVALDTAAAVALEKAGNAVLMRFDPAWDYRDVLEALYRLQWSPEPASLPHGPQGGAAGLVCASPAMATVARLLKRLQGTAVTVMINGPSGAGKELVARQIHQQSPRCDGPFVPVNCGAIPRELLESELFGHEKGAFTGAVSSRAGRFELAEGGTLFLDEIGDMPLDMQVKILRVIQERAFERVGSSKTLPADVRIIAATHRDLEAMVAQREFREDLFYRLNVFPIDVPALVERREDIPLLIRDIARELEADGLGRLRLTAGAECALQRYGWPGNVRELANLLERMLIICPDRPVGLGDLPERYRQNREEGWRTVVPPLLPDATGGVDVLPESGMDMKSRIAELEMAWIRQALAFHDGTVSKAASMLGLRRTTLIEKMRKYGL